MANYAIGDIQGCYNEFKALLELIQFNPDSDKVYLVGDLVNRGPMSLEVLRYVKQLSSAIVPVLGNHDLHLLACWAGFAKAREMDTLEPILQALDVDDLMHWLRCQPLLLNHAQFIITHAGVNPTVPFDTLLDVANFCCERLASDDYVYWLECMYGNTPTRWRSDLSEQEVFRFGINSLTRMRMFDGLSLDFKFKSEVASAPQNLKPWFDFDTCKTKRKIFGHWSALGLIVNSKIAALDTGCGWGGQLTALRLDDDALFQVPAFSTCDFIND